MPAKDQARIAVAVRSMADDPFSGDVLKLEGESTLWRRRVGDYRIFFEVQYRTRTVFVSAIVRRTSKTY
ncbi:MAG TPA: type II toxin-antitoxin system RelE/ParE family toxin [Bryobacteraceae bacterium]|nr:type II toxin-antitoxin system RelE/ParE family toxin [Bryobacteraceae bacterium]